MLYDDDKTSADLEGKPLLQSNGVAHDDDVLQPDGRTTPRDISPYNVILVIQPNDVIVTEKITNMALPVAETGKPDVCSPYLPVDKVFAPPTISPYSTIEQTQVAENLTNDDSCMQAVPQDNSTNILSKPKGSESYVAERCSSNNTGGPLDNGLTVKSDTGTLLDKWHTSDTGALLDNGLMVRSDTGAPLDKQHTSDTGDPLNNDNSEAKLDFSISHNPGPAPMEEVTKTQKYVASAGLTQPPTGISPTQTRVDNNPVPSGYVSWPQTLQ